MNETNQLDFGKQAADYESPSGDKVIDASSSNSNSNDYDYDEYDYGGTYGGSNSENGGGGGSNSGNGGGGSNSGNGGGSNTGNGGGGNSGNGGGSNTGNSGGSNTENEQMPPPQTISTGKIDQMIEQMNKLNKMFGETAGT